MTEGDAIDRVDRPSTVSSLEADLRDLGVSAGDTVLVHAAMSELGWVCVDARTVVDALRAVVTDAGTLVMPAFTGQYTDPARWENPPVPDDWVETIRRERPPFRPDVTPTRKMGAIAECFRTYPDVVRSRHPTDSFAAWGRDADAVVADHPLDDGFGADSPLARLYDRDASVLLLGVGHANNTSLHLAEHRADFEKERVTMTAPILRDGERVDLEFTDIDSDTEDFPAVGAAFERDVGCTTGEVGAATARRIDQRALVDYAAEWFEDHR